MRKALGVDACKRGWVGVELHDGRFASAHVDSTLAGLLAAVPDADAVGVDMPLGLMAAEERASDRAAQRLPRTVPHNACSAADRRASS